MLVQRKIQRNKVQSQEEKKTMKFRLLKSVAGTTGTRGKALLE